MSKRMREPFHTLMWKVSIGYNDSWSQVDQEVLEKFAESIVEECARIATDSNQSMQRNVGESVGDVIRNHFGT